MITREVLQVFLSCLKKKVAFLVSDGVEKFLFFFSVLSKPQESQKAIFAGPSIFLTQV